MTNEPEYIQLQQWPSSVIKQQIALDYLKINAFL